MAAFEYKALDSRGKNKKGLLEADTAKQIRSMLREQGLTPLEVTQAADKEKQQAKSGGGLFKANISAHELSLITRQLATLVQSALPVEAAGC